MEITLLERHKKDNMGFGTALLNDPIAHIILGMLFVLLWFFLPPHADKAALLVAALLGWKAISSFKASNGAWTNWHERLLDNYLPFTVLTFVAVVIGGLILSTLLTLLIVPAAFSLAFSASFCSWRGIHQSSDQTWPRGSAPTDCVR